MFRAPLVVLALLLAACTTPGWDQPVDGDDTPDDDDAADDDDTTPPDDDDATDDDDTVVPGDGDGDGFASEAAGGEDCDDTDASIFPGATEDPGNGADDDCDGVVDEEVTITSIEPDNGLAGGGTIVQILGSGFTGVTDVTVGGDAVPPDVDDDGTIEIVTDAGSVGAADVVVSHALSSDVASGGFTFTGTSHGLTSGELEAAGAQSGSPGTPTAAHFATVVGPGTADAGAAAGIAGEIGIGPQGFLPTDLPDSWSWSAASYDSDSGSADRWTGTVTPPTFGTYSITFRFSDDGGVNWLYVDADDSTGLDVFEMNQLEVTP